MSVSDCTILRAEYGDDNVYWCETFEKGDYGQAWTLAFAGMLITLGITLGNYPKTAAIADQIGTFVKKVRNRDGADIEEVLPEKGLEFSNMGGWTLSQYTCHQAILSAIYLVAKVLLFDDISLSNSNKEYNDNTFRNWCDAHTILVCAIFLSSFETSRTAINTIRKVKFTSEYSKRPIEIHPIALFSCFIFITDIIGTIVLLVFKYGYLIYSLYFFAAAFVVGVCLMITVCCWAPCLLGIVWIFTKIMEMFACGNSQSAFGKLLADIGASIVINAFGYLVSVLVIVFVWLFLGGPPSGYIEFYNEGNQVDIFYCLFIAAGYGLYIMLGGMIRTCSTRRADAFEDDE